MMHGKGTAGDPEAEGEFHAKERETAGVAEDMIAKIESCVAELVTVRNPGEGTPTLLEASEIVIEQSLAYEDWCEFGTPAGVIEVWVENKNVMTVQPGDASDFKGILFEMVSPAKAVVQVVRRADEVADTVVLLSRELQEVPSKGVRFTEKHPNNQEITLEVKPEGDGLLRLWLGFNHGGTVLVDNQRPVANSKGKAAAATAAFHRQIQRLTGSWGLPAFGSAAAVLALGVCAALLPRTGVDAPVRAVPAHDDVVVVVDDSSSISADAEIDDYLVGVAANAGMKEKDEAAGKGKSQARLKKIRFEAGGSYSGMPESSPTAAPPEDSSGRRGEIATEALTWEAQRLRRLAAVQSVSLRVDDSSQIGEAQSKELLASVGKALKQAGIDVVVNDGGHEEADSIMLVRFEPDATCFGAIFALMRDRAGNFLWQEHAGCRALQNGAEGSLFDDASARLVGKLPARDQITTQATSLQEESLGSLR